MSDRLRLVRRLAVVLHGVNEAAHGRRVGCRPRRIGSLGVVRTQGKPPNLAHVYPRTAAITSAVLVRTRPSGLPSPRNRRGQVSFALSTTAFAMNTGWPTRMLSAAWCKDPLVSLASMMTVALASRAM